MADIGDLADKAKDLAADNPDKIKGALDKAGDVAGDKLPQHEDKIDAGVEQGKGAVDKLADG